MNESSNIQFLQDLAVVMIAAGLVTLLFHQLRQPVVLGYLLAGLIIGPNTEPLRLISNESSIRTLTDLGVILLIFSLGLQFSLRTLKKVGATALIASSLEVLLMLWAGYELGQLFGWGRMDSLFLGAMLSITSTTIIVRTLTEFQLMKAPFAPLIFGIQIVEDILGITIIALLSGIALTGSVEVGNIAMTLGRVGIFLSVALVAGLIVVPRLLKYVARFQSDEMLLITALGLCFGTALLSVKLGYSLALGAFVIGTIIGEAREIGKIKILTEPVRDMFSAVFFVAIGMLIEPALLWEYAVPILIIAAVVIVGKTFAFSFGVFVAGHGSRTALRVGTSMVPIGELSFIIASLGVTLGVTSEFLYPIAVGVSVLTMPLSPYLVKHADKLTAAFENAIPEGLRAYLKVYSRWVDRLRARPDKPGGKLVRRLVWQMALNVSFITAVFLAAAYVSPRLTAWWPATRVVPIWLGGPKGLLWFAAALLALPFGIVVFGKLQAFAMLLSEMSVSESAARQNTAVIRAVVSRTIFVTGLAAFSLWLLVASAAFLPPWPALILLVGLVAIVAVVFGRYLTKLHAKARAALHETLSQHPPREQIRETPRHLLKEAELLAVSIAADSPSAGRLIGELELRSRTGASIVEIERADHSILVNPGPNEELQAGDKVLLLGNRTQLDAGRALLERGENAKE